MDRTDREREQNGLVELFSRLPGLPPASCLLLYAKAFPEEIDTLPMLEWTLRQGRRLVCPRVNRKLKLLQLFEVRDLARDFREGTLAIPEPAEHCAEVDPIEVDWVLVPGLGFDRAGFRIGRGAGHYDRLLPTIRPDVAKVALCFTPQWIEQVPAEPHDIPVDYVVDHRQTVATARSSQSS